MNDGCLELFFCNQQACSSFNCRSRRAGKTSSIHPLSNIISGEQNKDLIAFGADVLDNTWHKVLSSYLISIVLPIILG